MDEVIITPAGNPLKSHELPMIPATIKMLAERVAELMVEESPDWEWVIANLQEAHDLALVGRDDSQLASEVCICGCEVCACDASTDEG